MKGYTFTVLCGVLVWFVATLFFIIFGEYVLYSPGTRDFAVSLLLLVAGTGVLLWAITLVYLQFDQTDHAALKIGIIGTIIGLALDTFSLSFHNLFFPKLDDSQVIAFTAWMLFAYALYLIIPASINERRRIQKKVPLEYN